MVNREVRYTHRVRMDYSKKKLENPFHKTNHGIKRDELSLRLKISCLALLGLLVALLYLMFFSAVFDIKKIQVTGLSRINAGEVEKLALEQSDENRFWLFRQKNLLIFDKNALTRTLMDTYHFKEIKIRKSLFHTLKINLSEREYSYVWQEKDKYYYIDQDGYLINELALNLPPVLVNESLATSSTSTILAATTTVMAEDYYKSTIEAARTATNNSYPIIVNIGEEHFKGDLVDIDRAYLEFTTQLNNKIKANNEPDLTVKYFLIDKDFNTIKAVLNSGIVIYFSTKEDRDSQINNLLVLKKEKSDFNNIIKKKIDLRYGDKVYYE